MRKDLVIKECYSCGVTVKRRRSQSYTNVFCSSNCQAKQQRTGHIINCHTCKKEVYKSKSDLKKSKSGNYFCTRTCATISKNTGRVGPKHPSYTHGTGTYRTYALSYYPHECNNSSCPVRGAGIPIPTKMLDVDHIDSNRSNNNISNLQVLCVWCHAEKTRLTGI